MRRRRSKTWLLLLPPMGLFIKDIVATIAILATEPGITGKAVLYYSAALLPGSLFVSNGSAIPVNLLFGALMSLVLYLAVIRRKDSS